MDIVAFWQRVDQSGGPDACWPWMGAINKDGYGTVRLPGNIFVRAHRHAFVLLGGTIGEGLRLDHTCHNDSDCRATRKECLHRRCCNPAHHEPVTALVNNRRGNRWKREAA